MVGLCDFLTGTGTFHLPLTLAIFAPEISRKVNFESSSQPSECLRVPGGFPSTVLCAFIVFPFLATCQAHHNLLDCSLASLRVTELLFVWHFILLMAVILFRFTYLVGECILMHLYFVFCSKYANMFYICVRAYPYMHV